MLGRISGTLLIVYVLFKAIDTIVWINSTSPAAGVHAYQFYTHQPFSSWILFAEVVVFGLVPALILLNRKLRQNMRWLLTAGVFTCVGIAMNRFVMTIQTLALPTLPFDQFMSYTPSWQEVATFGAVIAYGVLIYSFSFRYLSLFPQERDLRQL